jgi:fibronectin type 3 domain-containing protein
MKLMARLGVFASVLFFLLAGVAAESQARQPPAYVLSAGDKVVIILGSVPRTVSGFTVFRKGPTDSSYVQITDAPVRPVDDPFVARQMMGSDFDWISRRVETVDPDAAWRRIRERPDLGVVLSFVSNGLRMALGRTYFDLAVTPGQTYAYRIVLLDSIGAEAGRIEKQVTVTPPRLPDAPGKVSASVGKQDVTVRWDYPRFQGGDTDLTVGFNVLRRQDGQAPTLLTPSPVLRIEGMLQFVDNDPVPDLPVTYSVQAVDLIGTLSGPVDSPQVTYRDTTPPMAPQGLTAVDRKDGVLLVWKISPEARTDHYIVYKSGREDSGYVQISKTPVPVMQPRFLDPDPTRGVAEYYKVTAVSRNGIPSAMSAAAPMIAQKTTPPPPVQGLAFIVDAKKRSVSLSWSPVNEPDLKGYVIYRGDSRNSMVRLTAKPLPPSPKPVWEDAGWQGQGLPSGRTLVYAVAAIDTSFNIGASAFAEVPIPDTMPPAAAFSLSARSTPDGRAALSWQPSLSRTLALHRVQRKSDADFATVTELPRGTVAWIDATVEKGKTYTYRIIEVNSSGVASAPSPLATLTVTSTVPPSPPASLRAEITPKGVLLTWAPSPTADTRGYLIFRAPYKGAQLARVTPAPVTGTSWLDAKGTKDTFYAVAVRDASGNESTRVTTSVTVGNKKAAQ